MTRVLNQRHALIVTAPTRPTYDDYLAWHQTSFGEALVSSDLGAKFDANLTLIQANAQSHAFMTNLTERLTELAKKDIFHSQGQAPGLNLVKKPYASTLDKLYRKNCLWNKRWPDAPKTGWIKYIDVYQGIDDLVRTTIVTKYLDGPELVTNEIVAAALSAGLRAESAPRALDSGYYGWHAYVTLPLQIIVSDTAVVIDIMVEFQVTTLLQSVLRTLTHRFYEKKRVETQVNRTIDRWDYESDQFRASYLGHTLHLVDAMIVELRNSSINSTGVDLISPKKGDIHNGQ